MKAWKPGTGLFAACAFIAMLVASPAPMWAADDGKVLKLGENSSFTPDPLQVLAPYVGGEWKINAKWSDGSPLEAREIFEWGVGRRFVTCKTFVSKLGGGEYQRYETIFGVGEGGKIVAHGFVYDGQVQVTEFKLDGKKLTGERPMKASDGGDGTLRQSVEQIEPNKFRWIVAFVKDGKVSPMMDGVWVREASTRVTN
jgi:hypothetical protein